MEAYAMTKRRDPLGEGKEFEVYAWPTVRRNFPLREGWDRYEQPTLPSKLRPDNILYNDETEEAVIVEMKDRVEITEADVRKVRGYMGESAGIVKVSRISGFVPIAWDTDVSPRVRRHARRLGIRFRRLGWRM